MRIFLSSVRRGLEEERDALPGLVRALGHDPVMFEDFTAMPVPSREACMQGVDSSDAYLLLMGEKYGDPLPETGQSPTHDEVVRAKHNGIARLVFVKSGVDMEPRQRELLDQLQAYSTGVFRGSFADTTDLMTQVTAADPTSPSWLRPTSAVTLSRGGRTRTKKRNAPPSSTSTSREVPVATSDQSRWYRLSARMVLIRSLTKPNR